MPAGDLLLPALARALFALPAPAQRALAGRPPPHAAGLAPDAWLVARLAARAAVPPGHEPIAEVRARFARTLRPVAIRPRLALATEDVVLAGPAGPLPARLYVP